MYSRTTWTCALANVAASSGLPSPHGFEDALMLVDGRVDPARDREHVVPQAAPQRLRHHPGDLVGDREENRVVGVDGDLPVEEAVGVAPDGAVLRVLPVPRVVHHLEEALELLVRREARRGERRDGRLHRGTRLEQRDGADAEVEHVGSRLLGEDLEGVVGHARARAVLRLEHAQHLQRTEGLTQRRPADAEGGGELALGREPLTATPRPDCDLLDDPAADLLVQLHLRNRPERP